MYWFLTIRLLSRISLLPLNDMHNFKDEVAASRTFVFVREIEPLLSAGLIKGGDLDNAIVIYERKMSQESFDKLADVMGVPHMDADQLGYINHKPLVWPNECARHKLLDVIATSGRAELYHQAVGKNKKESAGEDEETQ